MVVISLDSPSCGVCLFDPRTGGCIGTLPDRPRIVPFEVRVSQCCLYGDGQCTWAEIIQVVLPQLSDAKGSGSLNFTYFGATVPFRSSKRLGNDDRGQAANSPTKHQPEHGGIQMPGRSCRLRGYHNYLWGWAQTQVNTSLDTTSMLTITTLTRYLD